VEENLDKNKYIGKPFDYTVDTAELKADDVFGKVKEEYKDKDLIVVGSDTVVTKDNVIYEKPKDVDDAYRILNILNGQCHTVYSGVKIIFQSKSGGTEMIKFYEATDVKFSDLSENVIRAYIGTGEPMDKAGGYGIQGKGGSLVEHIRGDYFNVMGFPVNKFCIDLTKLLEERS